MTTIADEKIVHMPAESLVGNQVSGSPPGQVDDESSGLSDPDDRTGNEGDHDVQDGEEDISDVDDTEAETERLEETPRKQRNVLLTPSLATLVDHDDVQADDDQREETPVDVLPQASDSSPGETGDEEREPSISLSSRKRKRSVLASDHQKNRDAGRKKAIDGSKPSRSPSLSNPSTSPTPVAEDRSRFDAQPTQVAVKESHRRGKRKSKRVKADEPHSKRESLQQVESPQEVADPGELASSNEEDIDIEDDGERDGVDADSAAKTEEDLAKKKIAMDSLTSIEICFATLRDKLFDERLAQCNDELIMLEQPTFIHPELLLMKEVIDRRRDQKIQYEQTLLKFKLQTLQRESIANKAQVHSQYMLVAGELRDTYLSQINGEIYQTQRERRNCEADIPDFMYAFNPKRSKQITDQTAYNEEISLLSGIAKHVGFPAAPDIISLRSNEWEEDQKTYQHRVTMEDESNSARRASQHHPPTLRASLSAASNFGRPQPAAEDKFIQQNAWANPQHPANQKHRQASIFSQTAAPSATPANQRRVGETHGSASTIPENPSAPNSSVLPTPTTGEPARVTQSDLKSVVPEAVVDVTPSKVSKEMPNILGQATERSSTVPLSETQPDYPLFSLQNAERQGKNLEVPPKALPFPQIAGSPRASPPIRNPVIKAEDHNNTYGHSPLGQQKQGSPLVTASNC